MPPSNPETPSKPLGLFEAYGIELEYMIVSAETLDVEPAADRLLEAVAGELTDEHENGEIAWNNELALHVIELKCNGPRRSLAGLADAFQANVRIAGDALERDGLRLMPTAMHPWMDPAGVRLWPHGSRTIYETFDRIFGCKGHGWANLQSAHLNLPFANDEEFARLHASIRLLLPILPGLAASSPAIEGALTGIADNRLVAYRGNCAKIPSITGDVIPEPIYSIGEYQERLLERLYADLAPHDPDGVLRHEWVNARGAIARFERMAIEIRVLDVQECPAVDVAYAAVIAATLKSLCEERWTDLASLQRWETRPLAQLLDRVTRDAEDAEIGDRRYLAALGLPRAGERLAKVWEHLIDTAAADGALGAADERVLEHYLRHGTLATRIRRALGTIVPSRADLERVYRDLCDALAAGRPFGP
ncbi:MAG TPA: glutamate-cysteine ligase family protein [Gammaproteobacteria bacterium]